MNKIKYFIFAILLVPCIFMFAGCSNSQVHIVSVNKISETAESTTYSVLYDNGTTDQFTLENDGTESADIYALALQYGYEGTFWDFVEEYLHTDNGNVEFAVNKALLSAVSVFSNFTTTVTGYRFTINGLEPYTYEEQYSGAGSGVIYTLDKEEGDAYIITNYHVVYDANSNTENKISDDIKVYLYGMENDKSSITATYVGGSMMYDVAVLKVEDSDILKNSIAEPVEVASSDDLVVGQKALAVGNPEAMGLSATSGVVSVDSEYITMKASDGVTSATFRVMRIDTAINGGNSGGGLYNDQGRLIGIVNAKVVADGIDNISYAIPSDVVLGVVGNILDNSKVLLFDIGATINGENSRAVLDTQLNAVKICEDVTITEIQQDSVADKMGLEEGDVVKSIYIDSTTLIDRTYELVDELLKVRSGDTISITIERDGQKMVKAYSVNSEDFNVVS